MKTPRPFLAGILALTLNCAGPVRSEDPPMDLERARELFRKAQAGETLTPEEQNFLTEAKRRREPQNGGAPDPAMRERMTAIHDKIERGEKLTDDEQRMADEMRRRMAAQPTAKPGGGEFTWDKAHAAHEKEQRGDALNDDERKLLADARKRFEEGRGPDSESTTPPQRSPNPSSEGAPPAKDDFDWQKARVAHEKEKNGGTLNDDERKLVEAAKKRIAEGRGPGRAAGARGQSRPPLAPPPKDLVPLNELTGKYQQQEGGLYGGGKNDPPAGHTALAKKALAEIKPLDRDGQPAADGKVVLMSIGMSNTTMEFSTFVQLANADPRKAENAVIVDAAQGGKDAPAWASAEAQPWQVAGQRLQAAGVSPVQVQAVWIKQAIARPRTGFPSETERLRDYLREIVILATQKYPNLRVAYLSSRIYAGYATAGLNPEPYAYEGAFAVRWLIGEQIKGDAALNADAAKGGLKAPVLLWGPYLWANGVEPRGSDGLVFKREDFGGDGTHPSVSGQQKVANLLLDFLTKNDLAKQWFAK